MMVLGFSLQESVFIVEGSSGGFKNEARSTLDSLQLCSDRFLTSLMWRLENVKMEHRVKQHQRGRKEDGH